MLVHLGLDRILIYSILGQIILPLRGIDSILPETLIGLYQQIQTDKIYVITGPGSFTHMRIGILALHALSLLTGGAFTLLQGNKVSLYNSLVAFGYIPSSVFMYIGQKKNLRYYNFRHGDTHSVVSMEHIPQGVHDYAIDMFIAETTISSSDHEIGREWLNDRPNLIYRTKTIDCSDLFTPTENLQASYFVQPTIG